MRPPQGTIRVDLLSDTVTLPPPEMREAMSQAELGDDVYGEDPSVRRLEEEAALGIGLGPGHRLRRHPPFRQQGGYQIMISRQGRNRDRGPFDGLPVSRRDDAPDGDRGCTPGARKGTDDKNETH